MGGLNRSSTARPVHVQGRQRGTPRGCEAACRAVPCGAVRACGCSACSVCSVCSVRARGLRTGRDVRGPARRLARSDAMILAKGAARTTCEEPRGEMRRSRVGTGMGRCRCIHPPSPHTPPHHPRTHTVHPDASNCLSSSTTSGPTGGLPLWQAGATTLSSGLVGGRTRHRNNPNVSLSLLKFVCFLDDFT